MLAVFSPIFVEDTKMTFVYNFVASLMKKVSNNSQNYVIVITLLRHRYINQKLNVKTAAHIFRNEKYIWLEIEKKTFFQLFHLRNS